MSQYFQIHPDNPQPRLIRQAVQIVDAGGIVALPTDSSYALVCHLDDKSAAKVDNRQYRMLKAATPGPYTFILEATREVPRRLSHPSRKTIGLRVPEHAIAHALLEELKQPLLGTTLILPGSDQPLNEAEDIREQLEKQIDLVIDGGSCSRLPTTVVDLTTGVPEIVREGRGDVSLFR
jgi:tRNA threonylcarbamoyl adenosine modification protein (Sua5/YciO/YrdC/YwlC family)